MGITAACLNGRQAYRERLIQQMELVPNEPFRERYLWLRDNDPEFSLNQILMRLVEAGFPTYQRVRSDGTAVYDASRFRRNLGLKMQISGRGDRNLTTHIPYDFALALCYALGMDPVDGGV